MPKIRKTRGIWKRGRIYWINYMGVDGKQKFESTGSTLKANADLILAQRRLDVVTRGRHLYQTAGIGTSPSVNWLKCICRLYRIRKGTP